MKVELVFKTPDVIDEAAQDAKLTEEQEDEFRKDMCKYVPYGEYVTLVWDTETKSWEVKEASQGW